MDLRCAHKQALDDMSSTLTTVVASLSDVWQAQPLLENALTVITASVANTQAMVRGHWPVSACHRPRARGGWP